MKWFRAILAALKIASRVAPIPYVSLVADGVRVAESLVQGNNQGKIKKKLAKRLILESLRTYKKMQGKELYDEKKIVDNFDGLIDVLVDILNESGVLKRGKGD